MQVMSLRRRRFGIGASVKGRKLPDDDSTQNWIVCQLFVNWAYGNMPPEKCLQNMFIFSDFLVSRVGFEPTTY